MSHSTWAVKKSTGTPKTLDNLLQIKWEESSQAEWFVPCFHCTTNGHPTYNIPSIEYHLDAMIGPWREDISDKSPATICYKCGKPISPRFGRWVHRYKARRWTHAGYHIPQIIMPIHFADPNKWSTLLLKRRTLPAYLFYNEVLGEAYDTAAKLVTLADLNKAAVLWPNDDHEALQRRRNYSLVVLGVDWGGGGKAGDSYTTLALVGVLPTGELNVIWGKRLLTPHDHIREAKEIIHYCNMFSPDFVAHDYTGGGSLRETILIQSGYPLQKIMACSLVRSARQAPCQFIPATMQHPRDHYNVDKARTLLLTCAMIKLGRLRFFQNDYISESEPGLIRDFLALVEDKISSQAAAEIYRITKIANKSDDFAQAVNFACVAIWHATRSWPNLALGNN